jgi:hypothetical protein
MTKSKYAKRARVKIYSFARMALEKHALINFAEAKNSLISANGHCMYGE